WNTGYIFAKLEGQSDSSHIASHYFTYHIGGYKHNENAVRRIVLSVVSHQSPIININVDILKWFDGNLKLKIGETPACHVPGK
ncbi:MbnP family protein, partial [Acinetobacter baumannii]